jgi:hypothetical protein
MPSSPLRPAQGLWLLPALRRSGRLRSFVSACTLASMFLLPLRAESPTWWTTQQVLTTHAPDDFAVINQGQLKALAAKAAAEVHAQFGPAFDLSPIDLMIIGWEQNKTKANSPADDFAVVTLGQLKAVATPFYDCLGLAFPWDSIAFVPDDFAAVNIGQAKAAFAFDIVKENAASAFQDLMSMPGWQLYLNILSTDPGNKLNSAQWQKLHDMRLILESAPFLAMLGRALKRREIPEGAGTISAAVGAAKTATGQQRMSASGANDPKPPITVIGRVQDVSLHGGYSPGIEVLVEKFHAEKDDDDYGADATSRDRYDFLLQDEPFDEGKAKGWKIVDAISSHDKEVRGVVTTSYNWHLEHYKKVSDGYDPTYPQETVEDYVVENPKFEEDAGMKVLQTRKQINDILHSTPPQQPFYEGSVYDELDFEHLSVTERESPELLPGGSSIVGSSGLLSVDCYAQANYILEDGATPAYHSVGSRVFWLEATEPVTEDYSQTCIVVSDFVNTLTDTHDKHYGTATLTISKGRRVSDKTTFTGDVQGASDYAGQGTLTARPELITGPNQQSIVHLLPIEVEVTHIELGTENLPKTTLLRDEIAEIRIKIPPIDNKDWNIGVDVTPDDMRTANLKAPGSDTPRNGVLMFDFGKKNPNKQDRWESITADSDGTINSTGAPKQDPYYWIKLEASKGGELTVRGTFNKEGKLKVRLRSGDGTSSFDNKIDFKSSEFTIQKRIRQFAEYEDSELKYQEADGTGGKRGAKNQSCNKYDRDFEDAPSQWADWGYGFTQEPNYEFGVPPELARDIYEAELLKAIAFKETVMNAQEATINSKLGTDIMQLEAKGSESDAMNNGVATDFNAAASKVTIHGRKYLGLNAKGEKQYEEAKDHSVYLWDENKKDPAPGTNYGWPRMWYKNHKPPGPSASTSVKDNIKWALRDLVFKSHARTANSVKIDPDGPDGDTTYGLEPVWMTGVEQVLDAYGTGAANQYGAKVLKLRDEGRSGSRYGWPRLITKTARH